MSRGGLQYVRGRSKGQQKKQNEQECPQRLKILEFHFVNRDEFLSRSRCVTSLSPSLPLSLSPPPSPPHAHLTCEVPFPPRRSGEYRKGLIPRKSGSVIGADWQRSGPSCVLLKRVPQGQTEIGGIVPRRSVRKYKALSVTVYSKHQTPWG